MAEMNDETMEELAQAELLMEQGKYTEAETLCRKVLDLRCQLLGEDHSETADVQYLLGDIHLQRHQFADAQRFYFAALRTRHRLR